MQVYSQEAFPVDWARTQNNLGVAYGELPGGDREGNLRQAIVHHEAASHVLTREDFPADRAVAQTYLGNAYGELPGGDRKANLRKAIGYYEAALPIFSSMHMDDYSQAATEDLEQAKGELQKLNQPPQLPSTQQMQSGQELS